MIQCHYRDGAEHRPFRCCDQDMAQSGHQAINRSESLRMGRTWTDFQPLQGRGLPYDFVQGALDLAILAEAAFC
jgi:hypothetical protein